MSRPNATPLAAVAPSVSPPRKRQRMSSSSTSEDHTNLQDSKGNTYADGRGHRGEVAGKLASSSRLRALTPSQGSQELQVTEGEPGIPRFSLADATSTLPGFAKASSFDQPAPGSVLQASQYDPDNPFVTASYPLVTGFSTARSIIDKDTAVVGASAAGTSTRPLSPSPDEPPLPQTDYSGWFSNKATSRPTNHLAESIAPPNPPLGFTSAGGKSFAVSAAALQAAEAKMKTWEADGKSLAHIPSPTLDPLAAGSSTGFSTASSAFVSSRGVLASGHSSPGRDQARINSAADSSYRISQRSPLVSVPATATDLKGKAIAKPFHSPLLSRRAPELPSSRVNALAPRAGMATSFATPSQPFRVPFPAGTPSGISSLAPQTPMRSSAFPPPLGTSGRRVGSQKPFRTPFKQGITPGEHGYSRPQIYQTQPRSATPSATAISSPKKRRRTFFDLKPPPNRKTLETYGVLPGSYTADEIRDMGINADDLLRITMHTAGYYGFNAPLRDAPSLSQLPPTQVLLGPTAAYETLRELGCTLATSEWVENHWRCILWKLAGMVFLNPDREIYDDKRWSWDEVMRQLRYRYEREINCGSRPPLRLIATKDVSSAMPIILCVSSIFWDEPQSDKNGVPQPPRTEFELTDGWYRIRAKVDAPLVRAARKGLIKVGRKLSIMGANLSPKRTEPCEILEGYDKIKLSLVGNSTHLAPWHAKLGFMKKPPVATLSSLSPDGGNVPLMDLVIIKVHPLGFWESSSVDGEKRSDGPYDQETEHRKQRSWEAKRESAGERIRYNIQRKHGLWKQWEGKLKHKARGIYPGVDDTQPDHIDDLLAHLLENGDIDGLLPRVSQSDAAWVADALTIHRVKEHENLSEIISRKTDAECPHRSVKCFRILWMKDAYTNRKPSNRTAEVTVWNVTDILLPGEDAPVSFREGQRFRVTSLQPMRPSAWMPQTEKDARVYLYTLRWTRFIKI